MPAFSNSFFWLTESRHPLGFPYISTNLTRRRTLLQHTIGMHSSSKCTASMTLRGMLMTTLVPYRPLVDAIRSGLTWGDSLGPTGCDQDDIYSYNIPSAFSAQVILGVVKGGTYAIISGSVYIYISGSTLWAITFIDYIHSWFLGIDGDAWYSVAVSYDMPQFLVERGSKGSGLQSGWYSIDDPATKWDRTRYNLTSLSNQLHGRTTPRSIGMGCGGTLKFEIKLIALAIISASWSKKHHCSKSNIWP